MALNAALVRGSCSYNGCKKAIDEFLASKAAAGVATPLQVDPQSRAAWWVKPSTPEKEAPATAAPAAAAAAVTPASAALPGAAADPAAVVADPPPPPPPVPDQAVLDRVKLTIGARPTDTYYYYEDGYYAYPGG